MSQRRYPVLSVEEVEAILLARHFVLDHTKGDHRYYSLNVRGKECIAQVDTGCSNYSHSLIKLLLNETMLSREEFYCSTKTTAKKINKKCVCKDELNNWYTLKPQSRKKLFAN